MFEQLLQFNIKVLRDGQSLLSLLDDADYCCQPSADHDSTIGQHMRHIADHYRALANLQGEVLNYKVRRRNSAMESCVATAREEFVALEALIVTLSPGAINVITEVDFCSDASVTLPSSMERELAFVASHAIHHYALVAVLLRALGKQPPAQLGVAPATLHWRQQGALQ